MTRSGREQMGTVSLEAALAALTDGTLAFVREHLELAGVIVFALGFAESIAFVSLFVPSTILFLGIGGVHAAAGGQYWHLWLAGASGAALGDCVSYAFGRVFKNDAHRNFRGGKARDSHANLNERRGGVWEIDPFRSANSGKGLYSQLI